MSGEININSIDLSRAEVEIDPSQLKDEEQMFADYNKRFAITAEQADSAFVADVLGAWREILCVQEDRMVGNDNTVKWEGLRLQLPLSRLRAHFVKATVRVHEYPDGQLAVFWGPHRLADYDARGTLIDPTRQAA